jgi:hypothetical protein
MARAQLAKQKREFVEAMAGMRLPLEEIALLLVPPVTEEELKRDYAKELEAGPARENVRLVTQIVAQARKGNATILVYLSKAWLGWSEKGPRTEMPANPADSREAPANIPTASELEAEILNFPGRRSPRS